MGPFVLVASIVVFVLLVVVIVAVHTARDEMWELRRRVKSLESRIEETESAGEVEEKAEQPAKEVEEEEPEPGEEAGDEFTIIHETRPKEVEEPVTAETEQEEMVESETGPIEPAEVIEKTPTEPEEPEAPRKETLEQVLGGRWLNRIGAIALVLSVGFFLKYAFEQNWLSPPIRVGLGLIGASGLMALGYYARRRDYWLLSEGLNGAGIGVYYLSFYATYGFYNLLPLAGAFAGMASVTVGALLLSLKYDSRAVAFLGLLGGLLTPVLLSTGEPRTVKLFSYIALLDAGAAAIGTRRAWPELGPLAFGGTVALYIGWGTRFYTPELFPLALIFLVIFYGLFVATGELYRRLDTDVSSRVGELLIYGNAAACYLALCILRTGPRDILFMTGLAVLAWGSIVATRFLGDFRMGFAALAGTVLPFLVWMGRRYNPDLIFIHLAGLAVLYAAYAAGSEFCRDREWDLPVPVSKSLRLGGVAFLCVVMTFTDAGTYHRVFLTFLVIAALGSVALYGRLKHDTAAIAALAGAAPAFWVWLGRSGPASVEVKALIVLSILSAGYLAYAVFLEEVRDRREKLTPEHLSWGGCAFLYLSLLGVAFVLDPWDFAVYLAAATGVALTVGVWRRWRGLPVAVLAGTTVAFGYWLSTVYTTDYLIPALTVLSILTAELLAVMPALQLTGERVDGWRETIELAGAAVLSYAAFDWLLRPEHYDALGPLALGFTALYGTGTYLERRFWPELTNLLHASLGLSVVLLTWGIHLQFEGHWVPILWAIEAVGLVVLSSGPRFGWLAWAALSVFALSTGRTVAETGEMARDALLIFNTRVATYAVQIVCLTAASWLMVKGRRGVSRSEGALSVVFRVGAAALGGVLYTLEAIEFSQGLQTVFREGLTDGTHMLLSIGWTVYSVVLLAIGFLRRLVALRWIGLGILGLVVVKVFVYDLAGVALVYRIGSFFALGVVLMLGSLLYRLYGGEAEGQEEPGPAEE